MAVFFKGNLELSINPQETEAALTFTVDPQGTTWTREKVISLLREKSVLDAVNPATLESTIRNFAGVIHGSQRLVIARGLPPHPPTDSTLIWKDLPLPASLQQTARRLAGEAPPPEVYEYRTVKVPVHKNKGHDLPETAETAENAYRLERRKTRVTVSPTVKKLAYAQKGQPIASFSASLPGTPGKNIFGRLVPSPKPKRAAFFYGDDIEQKGNNIFAGRSGILRIGADWADIVPFSSGYYRVYTSGDGLDCFFDFSPGSQINEQEAAAEIMKLARRRGFADQDLIPPSTLRGVLQQAAHYKRAVKKYSLCTEIEPLIKLTVSPDNLSATLSLRKGRGLGRQLLLGEIGAVIRNSRLKNLDLAKIKQDILKFTKSKSRTLSGYVLATGTPPTKGEDGEIAWEIEFKDPEKTASLKALLAEHLTAPGEFPSLKEFPPDMVSAAAQVHKDERLAYIKPPTRGSEGRSVYGTRISGLPGKTVSYSLFENVAHYGHHLIAREHGFLERGEDDGKIFLRIRPSLDAVPTLKISPDTMQAFLSIRPAKGVGKAPGVQALLTFLSEEGVTAGIKQEALREAAAQSADGAVVEKVLVAEGQAPVHAVGERIQFHIHRASGKPVHIMTDGRADYKQQDKITVVKKGTLLAEITPALESGRDGVDVLGNKIPAGQKAGQTITTGNNITRTPQTNGKIKLTAGADGELIFKKDFIDIRRFHTVAGDVGLESGNIRFPGAIYVRGSVLSGFSVLSGDDIVVENVVEDALLSAEGSITVKQGIKGNGKAILRAKKEIGCLFAEKAVILAVGEIHIRNSLLHCDIKCNSRIILGREKGTIMGGMVKSKFGLEVINLGAASEVKTNISFGQDYLVGNQIEIEEKEINKLGDRVLEYDAQMRNYERSSVSNQGELRRIREEKLQCLKNIEKHSQRLFLLREKFEEHFPSEVIVKGSVFPGVTIESHGRKYEVREEQRMCAFVFNPRIGSVEKKPLT